MPDASQLVQVPFRAGLDEGTDESQLAPGSLGRVINAVWKKIGRIEKRDGSVTMGGAGATQFLQKLFARGNEIVATDGTDLLSFVRVTATWKRVQSQPTLAATWRTLVDAGQQILNVDGHATTDYRATAWSASKVSFSNDVYAQVEDVTTGTLVLPPTRIAAGAGWVRTLVLGTKVVFLYIKIASSTVYANSFDLVAGTFSGEITFRAINSNTTFDICAFGSNFLFVFKNSNNSNIQLEIYNALFAPQASSVTVATGVTNAGPMSVHGTVGERIYVAWSTTAVALTTFVAVHDATTLAQTTAGVTVRVNTSAVLTGLNVSRVDSTRCVVVMTEVTTADSVESVFSVVVSSTGVVATTTFRNTDYVRLISKVFAVGARLYALFATVRPPLIIAGGRVTQNSVFVVEVATTAIAAAYPHKLAAMLAPREGSSYTVGAQPMCTVPVVNDVAFALAMVVTDPATNQGLTTSQLRLAQLSTSKIDPWAEANIGNDLVTAGGANSVYDGRRQFELSFVSAPRVLTATPSTTGGAMAAGTYQYVFVYEWRDATGLLHRSIPSQPFSVTTTGTTGSVAFTLEPATTSCKADEVTGNSDNALPVRIVPYRTTAGGSSFYRLATASIAIILNSAVRSGSTPTTVAWTDFALDISIDSNGTPLATRPLLYTTGTVLDEVMPPSFTTLTLHRGRIWGVAGDRRTIWYTKKFTDDPSIFPGFHENLRVIVDQDIVALASLDDKLVIFCTSAIYILFGDGPNVQGQQSDLDGPNLVTANVGCVSAPSVVGFPGGLMFQAAQGIFVLSRQLEVSWIGRQVRDDLEAFPVITHATLVAHKSQVRIGCTTIDGSLGTVLVLDYDTGNWSTYVYPVSAVASSVVLAGTWYFTSAYSLVREDPTTSLDDGTWVPLDFELTLTPAGPIAWQHIRRVKLLGTRQTDHDLRIRFAFDFLPAYSQDFTFTSEKVAQNNDSPTVRVGSQNGANPKCKSIRIRVTDATPTGTGASVVGSGKGGWFSAIGLELIPKQGMSRHGARYSKV